SGRIPDTHLRREGKYDGRPEGPDGNRVFPCRYSRSGFDFVPADLTELPPVWERVCRRKHAGSHGAHCASIELVNPDSFLFPGNSCWPGASARLHAADRSVHTFDHAARRESCEGPSPLKSISAV